MDEHYRERLSDGMKLFGRIITHVDPFRLDAWAGLGLTMTQLRLLFLLRSQEGPPAGALAERIGVTPSTLTRIMDRLARNHLVRRDVDGDDRRLVRHHLTEAGLQAVEELERTGRIEMRRLLGRLTPEQLERLVEGLRDLVYVSDAIEAERAQEAVV